MKKTPSSSPFSYAVLLTVLLTGCGGQTQTSKLMGGATEYLADTPAPRTRHTVVADADNRRSQERAVRKTTNAHSTPATTTASNGSTSDRKAKKVEAEIHDPSEVKIDDETRQQMASGGTKTANSDKKPKKVEAEVRNPSDVQIDDQTRQEMDKPH